MGSKTRLSVALVTLTLVAGIGGYYVGHESAAGRVPSKKAGAARSAPGPLPTNFTTSPATSRGASHSSNDPVRALRTRLLASTDLKAALDQLRGDATIPASERLFYEAVILERCAMYKDLVKQSPPELVAAANGGTMGALITKVSAAAKTERQREAIKLNIRSRLVNLCRNFAGTPISDEQFERAFAAAAAAGSSAAQARMVEKRLADSGVENASKLPDGLKTGIGAKPGGYPDPITPAEQSQLVQGLFSGDPVAIRHAGVVMSVGSDRQSLRVGPENIDLGQGVDETWTLAACQFGFECGLLNAAVNHACAQQARCVDSYEDYLRNYALTPQEFARVQNHANLIAEAIRRRDASAFNLVSAPGQVRTIIGVPGIVPVH